jgi:CO/xanthine dehydrogenase Mo-binding subunit
MDKLYDHVRAAKVTKRAEEVKRGDTAAVLAKATKVVEAQYEWPFQSHASMGPACAVVDAKADRCTVWTGSQKPHFVRDGVAKLLGLPQDKVHAIWVAGPGSYGRNDAGDAAMDAAFLSKKLNKPVRVQGMRMDGTAWDPKAPACVHRGRAAIDASGKVVAYEFLSKGFSRQQIATNESDPADSLVGLATGVPPKGNLIFGVPAESYGFDNKLLAWETIPPLVAEGCSPLRTSHLRDPVGPEIHFGSEQFIDELAHAAGEDPVAFRLQNVATPTSQVPDVAQRWKNVLEGVVKLVYGEDAPNSRRTDIPKDGLVPVNRMLPGKRYFDVSDPKYADMTPMFNVVKEIMKGREGK